MFVKFTKSCGKFWTIKEYMGRWLSWWRILTSDKTIYNKRFGGNWEYNIHRGVLERKTFDYICNDYINKEAHEEKKYHIYPDKKYIEVFLLANKTLSCIYKKDNTFVFVLKNQNEIQLNMGAMIGRHNHLN